ncbi:GNAT family N-acetyltransferase [Lentzea sp. NPDC060358]|uniref:GNAT family N-acetyltransferase n=1 Tax=Lentzea sp. NPDC060358 TaxID=3347103 RepID=UPI0036464E0F
MLIRTATAAEVAEPADLAPPDPVVSVGREAYLAEVAAGRMRPEWTWYALDGSRVVARALWWGREDSDRPLTLDCLHVLPGVPDRVALATELLERAHAEFGTRPEYRVIRGSGLGDPAVADAVSWRAAAARAAGLTDVVERLRYEWTPEAGVPAPSRRLVFRPAPDDEFLALFRRAAVGSLDVATRRDLETMDADEQAQADLEFYLSCPGERSWWRVATTPEGDPVGFAVPSATPYHRNVGYLGVLPERRGQGYVDDLLGEITRVHADGGAERITATTDVPNKPMAAAFDRAGYSVTEVRTVFTAPSR